MSVSLSVCVCVCVVSISSENSQHEFNFDFYLAFIRFLNVERFNWIARDPDSISGWPPPAPPRFSLLHLPILLWLCKVAPNVGQCVANFIVPLAGFAFSMSLQIEQATCNLQLKSFWLPLHLLLLPVPWLTPCLSSCLYACPDIPCILL